MTLFDLARRALFLFEPERAHRLTIMALKSGLLRASKDDPPVLGVTAMGRNFPNPVGLAAGFDKNAEVPDAMLRLGFGFVECGTVTPRPQSGNPRPRIFRLPEDQAVINRLGFNNEGMEAARQRLARRSRNGIVGINIGANKDSADRIRDYGIAFRALAPHADYVTVNISSPNTPGLRGLQSAGELDALLDAVNEARAGDARNIPVLVKIAPDLDDEAIGGIVDAALRARITGLIISNTTIGGRDELRSAHRNEAGGLSGEPLRALSTRKLAVAARAAGGRLLLIGAGGVSSGAHAFDKIRAGATLVQLYTGLIYGGPGLVSRIKRELLGILEREKIARISDVIGRDAAELAR
ncbi:MAG TPA: quinone-dependent dihydroorotate dehydrogenase [Micropepsaceae bacterium]|nr:quinone-dependent dihydroorotate dehydrogenase [Micropepsaceae bacterium]HRK70387.1 quinone-dependent dihydroorotate dehydrogenase [Micropepsaceae bacterium]